MPDQSTCMETRELTAQLNLKRNLFENMLTENKEFEEVKTLFYEIRDLEKKLKQNHQGQNLSLKP